MLSHAEPCSFMQSAAEPCRPMKSRAALVQTHTDPCRAAQSRADSCSTRAEPCRALRSAECAQGTITRELQRITLSYVQFDKRVTVVRDVLKTIQ